MLQAADAQHSQTGKHRPGGVKVIDAVKRLQTNKQTNKHKTTYSNPTRKQNTSTG
jgi:hypothetical protein